MTPEFEQTPRLPPKRGFNALQHTASENHEEKFVKEIEDSKAKKIGIIDLLNQIWESITKIQIELRSCKISFPLVKTRLLLIEKIASSAISGPLRNKFNQLLLELDQLDLLHKRAGKSHNELKERFEKQNKYFLSLLKAYDRSHDPRVENYISYMKKLLVAGISNTKGFLALSDDLKQLQLKTSSLLVITKVTLSEAEKLFSEIDEKMLGGYSSLSKPKKSGQAQHVNTIRLFPGRPQQSRPLLEKLEEKENIRPI